MKQSQLKQSVNKLAFKLHDEYLQKAHDKPRDFALRLINLVVKLQTACQEHETNQSTGLTNYQSALIELKQVLMEKNKSISSYELSISGLVPTLIKALCPKKVTMKSLSRVKIFANVSSLTTNQIN